VTFKYSKNKENKEIIYFFFLLIKIVALKESLAKAKSEDVKATLLRAIKIGVTRLQTESLRTSILKYHFDSTPRTEK
jgi:hypothetical protein